MTTLSLRGAMLMLAPSLLAAQAVPPDSLAARLRRAEAAIQALQKVIAEQSGGGVQSRSHLTVEVSGRILTNGFFNSQRVNNVDNPQYADSISSDPHGLGASIRQTRLGVVVRHPSVLGGTFEGDLDADFNGGQLPSSGGRTFPLLRLRTAKAILRWSGASLLIGQEAPLVSGLNPVSPTAVGTPLFSNAGNLWQWVPQARFGFERVGELRFGAQAAVLAPMSGDPAGAFETGNDLAERTYRPFVQGRVYVRWGPDDLVSEIGCGVHKGWLQPASAVVSSDAVACDALIPMTDMFELRGEFFTGEALGGLGGGGIGQNFTPTNTSLSTTGGWAQLNLRPMTEWRLGAGCGEDHPEEVATRRRNDVCAGYTIIEPAGPFFLGAEYRFIRTEYASGRFTSHFVTMATGFSF